MSTELTEPLTVDTVLARRDEPHVAWVEVEGEVVAWVQESESMHLLDPIGAVIFQLCDGTASLADTIGDLSEAFGRPQDSVRGDVLSFAASLEAMGLVERV
jgi:hypothetical protein